MRNEANRLEELFDGGDYQCLKTNVASSLFSVKFQRNIEELLVAPVHNIHVIIMVYVGGVVARGAICVGILVTVVSLFFMPLQVYAWWTVVVTLLLTSVLFSPAGLLNSVFAKSFDDISIMSPPSSSRR